MKTQIERFDAALARGMPRMGWKVGINVPEVLQHLDLAHPGVGWLNGNNVFRAGDAIAIPEGSSLKLEPELAIHLRGSVSPGSSAAAARDQIRGVCPAFEIVDYAQPRDGLDTIVSHSMFHFGCVLGDVQPLDAMDEMGMRWPVLEIEGTDCPAPRADLVPQDLGALVSFVASYLKEFGQNLEAGDIIMSGSYTATAVDLSPGIEVRGDYGALGSISVRA